MNNLNCTLSWSVSSRSQPYLQLFDLQLACPTNHCNCNASVSTGSFLINLFKLKCDFAKSCPVIERIVPFERKTKTKPKHNSTGKKIIFQPSIWSVDEKELTSESFVIYCWRQTFKYSNNISIELRILHKMDDFFLSGLADDLYQVQKLFLLISSSLHYDKNSLASWNKQARSAGWTSHKTIHYVAKESISQERPFSRRINSMNFCFCIFS